MKIKDLCFEIIEKCPNNCKFCSSCSSIYKNRMVELDDFKRVIDYFMSQGGIEEISISGGEPFLHPNIVEIIKYCKKNNITTALYTSGITNRNKINTNDLSLLSCGEKKIIESLNSCSFNYIEKDILLKLKSLNIDKIVFDLQTVSYDTYNDLMGTNNYISYALKSILNTVSLGINAEIHFIPLKSNYKQILDVLEVAQIGEVKTVRVLKFVPQGRGRINKDNLILSEDEYFEFMQLIRNQKMYSGNIKIGIPLLNENTHLCTAGYDKLTIRYDGAILPCPAFKEIEFSSVKNIYVNLKEVEIASGNRKEPLCKKIHKVK